MKIRLTLGICWLLVLAPPLAAHEFALHVNVGGDAITFPDGTEYVADGEYTPAQGYGWYAGWDHETWHAIGGCVDDRLYQQMHHAPDLYQIDCPNGSYAVTLNLCDIWSHGVGQRWAGWRLNGVQVIDHLDIYAEVERDYAIDYRFATTVTNGQVRIEDTHFNGAMLYGVAVVARDPDTVAPATPVLTEILGGYEQVILNWQDNTEDDLAGYQVRRRVAGVGVPVLIYGSHPNLVSRYVDQAANAGVRYEYWIRAVDIYGNASADAGPFSAMAVPHESSPLPVCEIVMDPDTLAALNVDPNQEIYYSCIVTLEGQAYNAGLRYRGNVVRNLLKKSYKIKLDDGPVFHGRSKLNCNSEMCDPCLMRESLSMDLFADADVPAPQTWWRMIVLNDQAMGAFCDVEQIDENFLAREGLDVTSNVYKCEDRLVILPDSASYPQFYEKETNEHGSWSDLIDFIELLNLTPDDSFYEAIIDCFDVNEFLNYFGVLMTINDGDAIYKNFYLVHDIDDNQWRILPWDKDLTWGVRWIFLEGVYTSGSLVQGVNSGGNILYWRMLSQPALRNVYASRIYELLTERFPLESIYPRIDATHAETEANGEVDYRKWYWEENARLRQGDEELRGFAEGRYGRMLADVGALVTPQALYINEFMAANANSITDEYGENEDWIEIYNPGPDSVAMGDYFLTDNLLNPIQWAFPDTTLAPGGMLLVWADQDGWQGPLHANFKLDRNGELIALHRVEAGAVPPVGPDDIDPVDLVFFGPQVDDISRARMTDGDYRWTFPDSATPGMSNEPNQGIDDENLRPGLTEQRLLAAPNPSCAAVSFSLPELDAPGVIEVFDAGGRLCRSFPAMSGSEWIWDGRMQDGQLAGPGCYWARMRTDQGHLSRPARVILIR